MNAVHAAAPTEDERQPGSLAWLWALLAVSVVLLSTLSLFALLPVAVLLLVAGVLRRLTAAAARDRTLGTAVAGAGLALAGVIAAIGLTLMPIGEGEVVLEELGHVDVQVER